MKTFKIKFNRDYVTDFFIRYIGRKNWEGLVMSDLRRSDQQDNNAIEFWKDIDAELCVRCSHTPKVNLFLGMSSVTETKTRKLRKWD